MQHTFTVRAGPAGNSSCQCCVLVISQCFPLLQHGDVDMSMSKLSRVELTDCESLELWHVCFSSAASSPGIGSKIRIVWLRCEFLDHVICCHKLFALVAMQNSD